MKIATTLVVLLTLAVLLSSIVFVAFWQKGLVHAEVDHMKSLMSYALMNSNSIKRCAGNAVSSDDLKALCRYVGKHCVGVTLSGGDYWFKNDMDDILGKSQKTALKSAVTQREVISLEGNPWGFLSFEKSYLLIAQPILNNAHERGASVVVILEIDSIYESIFDNHKAIFVYLLVNIILLTGVGLYRLIAVTIKPVQRMVKMLESYQDSDLLLFGGEENRSEFCQLSMALNGMLSRIESGREKLRKTVVSLKEANAQLVHTQKEMVRTEKIASVGRLSAGLAHEIGNPIGIVQGYVELLQQSELNDSDKQQFTERALEELDRVNKLIRQLLDYAGASTHEISTVNLSQLFEGIRQIISFKHYNPPIAMVWDIPSDIFIECDGESLRQVFLNCLLNAIDAIESREGKFERQISITVEENIEDEISPSHVCIRIKDNGTGIEKDDLKAIFDPFFTTKVTGKGTGLGLFVSHAIIDAHGGGIWINSTLGKGSTVYINLPRCLVIDK